MIGGEAMHAQFTVTGLREMTAHAEPLAFSAHARGFSTAPGNDTPSSVAPCLCEFRRRYASSAA